MYVLEISYTEVFVLIYDEVHNEMKSLRLSVFLDATEIVGTW